jgi:deoxyribodipyrimidine photo-lyase
MLSMSLNEHRLFPWNHRRPNLNGDYVLYWMQIHRRLQYNFALEEAVHLANQLGKPLLIYEGLKCDYPWACDRFHQFLMEGMQENSSELRKADFAYYCYVENEPGAGKGLVRALSDRACALITDHFPVFIIREHNERLGPTFPIPYTSVDSNGVYPLRVSTKAPYSAYEFRKLLQKHFVQVFQNPPIKDPLKKLKNRSKVKIAADIRTRWPDATSQLANPKNLIRKLPVNHSVKPLEIQGTRKAALHRMQSFLKKDL